MMEISNIFSSHYNQLLVKVCNKVNYALLFYWEKLVLQLLTIAGGGALGAVLRFGISSYVYSLLGRDFPYGTIAVNMIGSLLMGLLFVLFVERGLVSAEWRSAIIIGFLGAFTTFSTFSIETLMLVESGELTRAAMNVVLSVTLCLFATWFGLIIGRHI
ncbi:hypothetical protein LCGC14_0762640 [marine sediment metagenome]|uniref:Fluoride ion transporter CrcB n=1 Tax=marine sediment metagenome TaxID=412755 RepID=A0A0F9T7P8_9ZZZZ